MDINDHYKESNELIMSRLECLVVALTKYEIQFCSIGPCTTTQSLGLVPKILAYSSSLATSFQTTPRTSIEEFTAAARCCLELSKRSSIANFSFCVSSNCPPFIPFFPASYCQDGTDRTTMVGVRYND